MPTTDGRDVLRAISLLEQPRVLERIGGLAREHGYNRDVILLQGAVPQPQDSQHPLLDRESQTSR